MSPKIRPADSLSIAVKLDMVVPRVVRFKLRRER